MAIKETISHFVLKYLAIPRSPKVVPGKTHIACIGDSITFGAGVGGKANQTWEYHLNEILGGKYQVLNYGISGRTLQKEGDYPYTADKFYKESLHSGAEIFLIMLGSNDAKPYNWNAERYEQELDSFCWEYSALPNRPKLILMTPPQCFVDPKTGKVGFDIDADTIDRYITEIIKNLAAKRNYPLIDLHELTKGHEDWFVDGVHPNALGNQRIAEHIASELCQIVHLR